MRPILLLLASLLVVACAEQPKKATTTPATEESAEAAAEPSAKAAKTPKVSDDIDEAGLVTAPTEGSPEAVIRALLAASMNPDVAAGWEATRALLHSNRNAPRAIKSYEQLNYPASRRKVHLFTPEDGKPHFRIARTQVLNEGEIKLFVHNEKSMPTPCILRKDPEADGAWRVHVCSL